METRRLGAHGPDISVVGYGAWQAGGRMWGAEEQGDDRVLDAMRAAVDAGMSWIDTAETYGDGHSERLVGQVARARREEVLVFTKVAQVGSGLRAEDVRRAVRGSLHRLGIDHVDLYQIHSPPRGDVPVEEAWQAMAGLVDEGLVRWIGVSNFDRPLVERCLAIRHVDSVQNQLSLLHQDDRAELLPFLRDRGIGYLAYGPLAFGLLTGAITRETEFDQEDWRSGRTYDVQYYEELFAPGAIERSLDRVERVRAIADRRGVSLAALALRAAVDVPGVTAAIAGSRDPGHTRGNAEAGSLALDEATRRAIDEAVA